MILAWARRLAVRHRDSQFEWLRYRIGCDTYTGSFEWSLEQEWLRENAARLEELRAVVRDEISRRLGP